MIEVEGLTKLYGEFVAVNELSFTVRPGEALGLVGPNGAGKTSTLRCVTGIIPPTQGRIRVCDHDLAAYPVIEPLVNAEFRRPCTLAKGDSCCDFNFYRRGFSPDGPFVNK